MSASREHFDCALFITLINAGQLKMGFSIISNAFNLKVKSLDEELNAATNERNELQKKVCSQRCGSVCSKRQLHLRRARHMPS